jgi:hypothetical protein
MGADRPSRAAVSTLLTDLAEWVFVCSEGNDLKREMEACSGEDILVSRRPRGPKHTKG